MKEIFKEIKGWEELYKISNYGRVYSVRNNIILKSNITPLGYEQINLCLNGWSKTYRVNRLVALAFLPKIENKPDVNHKDGHKLNNRLDNLEWCDKFENMQHAKHYGLLHYEHGERHHLSKLSKDDVDIIKSLRGVQRVYEVAAAFNISWHHVYNIWAGWKRVDG